MSVIARYRSVKLLQNLVKVGLVLYMRPESVGNLVQREILQLFLLLPTFIKKKSISVPVLRVAVVVS